MPVVFSSRSFTVVYFLLLSAFHTCSIATPWYLTVHMVQEPFLVPISCLLWEMIVPSCLALSLHRSFVSLSLSAWYTWHFNMDGKGRGEKDTEARSKKMMPSKSINDLTHTYTEIHTNCTVYIYTIASGCTFASARVSPVLFDGAPPTS